MMNVAFVCDGFPLNADLRAVESGNPGLGGTQYMFALIASVLAKRSNEITVHFYTDAAIVFCRDLNVHVCKPGESLRCALGSANDLCIIRGNVADCDYFEVLSSPMPIITWSHNFETYDFLQKVAKANQIIANVCVSQQQLDRLRDCTAVTKSLVINNGMGFEGINCLRSSLTADSSRHVVCWLGSIVPGKGFHALASIWPDIRKAVPDAELHVIGGSDLYVLEAGKELGTLGLTEKKYEDSFSSYLVNSSGQLDKSIHLFGVMGGTQKLKVMAQSSVGVVNPLGSNETFCLSAVEFESIGVPVVSRGRGGLLDVVSDGETGYLAGDLTGVTESIIKLLLDKELRHDFGANAAKFAKSHFDIELVAAQWEKLIVLQSDYDGFGEISDSFLWQDFKWAREVNRRLKRFPLFKRMPSLIKYEAMAKQLIR